MTSNRKVIFNFHGIGEPHDGVDPAERPYWVSEDSFKRIVDDVLALANAEQVVWTFDDGNVSDLTIGAKLLQTRGLTAIFFLLAGRFSDPRYLSPKQARELVEMGMTVGLHGSDHRDWRNLDAIGLYTETVCARERISEAVRSPVDLVAIPFGAYDRKVIRHLFAQRFRRIYTSDGGASNIDQRICSRTSIRNDMSFDTLSALVLNRIPAKTRLRRAASTIFRRYVK